MSSIQYTIENDLPAWLFVSDALLIAWVVMSISLFIIATLLAKPWMVGHLGQMRIQKGLQQLTRKGATVLNHIQLPDQTGSTFHLDHLIITNRHLIAISIIGFPGNIYGSLRDAMWIQETAQGNTRFTNPIRTQHQIEEALAAKLGSRQEVYPITVFTAGELHTTESKHIIQAKHLSENLKIFTENIKIGARISWASQLISNLVIGDEEGRRSQEKAFLLAQGNPKQLTLAKIMTAVSTSLMLLTISAVSIRFMTSY